MSMVDRIAYIEKSYMTEVGRIHQLFQNVFHRSLEHAALRVIKARNLSYNLQNTFYRIQKYCRPWQLSVVA